ncbi:hypothetical protein SH528x_002883 [Novipirellula sp. SH528]|uniref:hypothetical protein n=1 Tax=Novipirellula sp. SH528 TaxID=3454466 RepID=UPI003FA0A760
MRILLIVHAVLLLLASTAFTIVSALFGGTSIQWCYYRYSFRSGFGTRYVSDYSLPVVATYLLAFAFGIVGFAMAFRDGRRVTGFVGVILSAVGFISFAIESSHWLVDHHRSWIVFVPAAMLALVVIACIPERRMTPESKPSPS